MALRNPQPEDEDTSEDEVNLIPIQRITDDLREAARTLTTQEVRYLCDLYYQTQRLRIRSAHQTRIAALSAEPNRFFTWTLSQMNGLEQRIKAAMQEYALAQRPGRWAMAIRGIGPVLTAGMLAYINVERQTTPSKLWAFAGLDPTRSWLGKDGSTALVRQVLGARVDEITDDHLAAIARQAHRPLPTVMAMAIDENGQRDRATLIKGLARRPWSERLKTLQWKAGDCLVKQGGPNEPYRTLYTARKAREWERNLNGDLSDQARDILASRNIGRSTEAYEWYSGKYLVPKGTIYTGKVPKLTKGEDGGVPMLPPAHIHMRAQRYMMKVFLVHLWRVCYESAYNQTAPRAYILDQGGHQSDIPIPGWPCA